MAGGVVDGDENAVRRPEIIEAVVALVACLLLARIASDDVRRSLVVDLLWFAHMDSPFLDALIMYDFP